MTRANLEVDGIKEIPQEELQSFIAKIISNNNYPDNFTIHIPVAIVRRLSLKPTDFVLAGIKKATEEEKKQYKFDDIAVRILRQFNDRV